MNLISTVVSVCLLAVVACDAKKIWPRGSGHYGGLSIRQDPPTCAPCNLTELPDVPQYIELLVGFANTLQDVIREFSDIFQTEYETPQDLRLAIDESLGAVEQKVDDIIDQLSTAVQDTDACPPLGILILGLRAHLNLFLAGLTRNWDTIETGVDTESRFAALAQAMAPDIPDYFILLRDLLFSWADVILTKDCDDVAFIIYAVLQPYGELSAGLSEILSGSGEQAIALAKNILGSLLPGGGAGALDLLSIMIQLLCGTLEVFLPNTDFSQITNIFCPDIPDDFEFSNTIISILCEIADAVGNEVLPSEIRAICLS